MRRALTVGILGIVCAAGLCAAAKRRPAARSPVRTELRVAPSEAVEDRVRAEMRKADEILERMDEASLLESPYVVSALYYRDGFLNGYDKDRSDADPARRIISHIARQLTPERKREFVRLLHGRYDEREPKPRPAFVSPMPYKVPPKPRSRRIHANALDLFAPEGTAVVSASAGVVLLAEQGWTESDPFSTSSHAGGNSVIVFDPASDRFYRYCHFETVTVTAGQAVEPGDPVGTIGHSGLNASRPRHGGHVHFEVHRWRDDAMRPLENLEIWELFRSAAR
jgi:murein DD-endopeptidase MepM/ murein hydrolase activator NlpD